MQNIVVRFVSKPIRVNNILIDGKMEKKQEPLDCIRFQIL